jgi:ribosomal subunit interface protein
LPELVSQHRDPQNGASREEAIRPCIAGKPAVPNNPFNLRYPSKTMQIPLQISFRHMDPSAAVEAEVRKRVSKLEQFFDRMTSCRVVIEAPHRHHHKGKLYQVRIDITVPGKEIAVAHEGPQNAAHKDVYVAVRDAFNAAGRRIEDHARKIRGEIKKHQPEPGD